MKLSNNRNGMVYFLNRAIIRRLGDMWGKKMGEGVGVAMPSLSDDSDLCRCDNALCKW